MPNTSELTRVALHECGHAIAAMQFAAPVRLIWASSTRGGKCQWDSNHNLSPEASLLVSDAGPEAELIAGITPDCLDNDWEVTAAAANSLGITNSQQRESYRKRAVRFVFENENEITFLANQLLAHPLRRLMSEDIAALCYAARSPLARFRPLYEDPTPGEKFRREWLANRRAPKAQAAPPAKPARHRQPSAAMAPRYMVATSRGSIF
jgi:hypothetical protein